MCIIVHEFLGDTSDDVPKQFLRSLSIFGQILYFQDLYFGTEKAS